MAATFTAGYFFSDTALASGNTCSYDLLHALVDGATASGFVKSEFSTATRIVEVAASAPGSPTQGDGWYDTDLNFLRLYTWNKWDAPGVGFIGDNQSGFAIPQYAVVELISGGVRHVRLGQTNIGARAAGVAMATMMDGTTGLIMSTGQISVLVTGGAVPGDVLVASDTTGYAINIESLTSLIAIPDRDATVGQDFAVALATCIGTGLCTAFVYK